MELVHIADPHSGYCARGIGLLISSSENSTSRQIGE
jgi:hypothetical protein